MQSARTFEDLIVWQKAHQFVLGVYQLTANCGFSQIRNIWTDFSV